MFGPRRSGNTRVPLPRRRGSSFYWNKCKCRRYPMLCKPVAMACNGMQHGAPRARYPHEMEAESYANAPVIHACMSRLNQGWVLLSGFAQAKKSASHSEIRCITITRKLQ